MSLFNDPKTNLAVLELLAKMDFADLEKRVMYLSLERNEAVITQLKEKALFYTDPLPFFATPTSRAGLPEGCFTHQVLSMEELSRLNPLSPAPPKKWGKKGKRLNLGQAYQAAIAGKTKGFR